MTYLYGNDWQQARDRLRGLERIEDEHTFRYLVGVGVAAGWQCLEVGAGAGSVAAWLCERVGPSGRVVATDTDTRHLAGLRFPQLEVRTHDIAEDPPETEAFDLVHARHVLIHLPSDRIPGCLRKLAESLKPGGRIVLEESDFSTHAVDPSTPGDIASLYTGAVSRIRELYRSRGMDLGLGLNLFGMMEAAGIVSCRSEGRMRIVRGGSEEAGFHKRTFTQLRREIVDGGGADSGGYDDFLRLHDDPRLAYRTRLTVTTWGRRTG